MKSKAQGTVAQLKVAQELIRRGYSVFYEYGDSSRIDLIAVKGKRTIKLQIKSTHSKNNVATLTLRKCGHQNSYVYKKSDVDYFGLYVIDKDDILFISSGEALKFNKAVISFRYTKPIVFKGKRTRLAAKYKTL